MQVTRTTTTTPTIPLNAAANHAAVPGQDFLSAVDAAYAATASTAVPATEEARPAAGEVDPIARYQAITGRNVAERDPAPVSQSRWSDETLAHFVAGQFTGDWNASIDTTNTIDWQSQGDHELTAEEIAQLKEKYDVSDLSAQEYYDLMSDLTHMGVLSGDDVMGVYLATIGSEVGFTSNSLFSGGAGTVQGGGNVVNYFATALSRLLESWEWLNSSEYKAANYYLGADKQELIRSATLKDLQVRQKMFNVLTLLQ